MTRSFRTHPLLLAAAVIVLAACNPLTWSRSEGSSVHSFEYRGPNVEAWLEVSFDAPGIDVRYRLSTRTTVVPRYCRAASGAVRFCELRSDGTGVYAWTVTYVASDTTYQSTFEVNDGDHTTITCWNEDGQERLCPMEVTVRAVDLAGGLIGDLRAG